MKYNPWLGPFRSVTHVITLLIDERMGERRVSLGISASLGSLCDVGTHKRLIHRQCIAHRKMIAAW
jgi:hypothetical protein